MKPIIGESRATTWLAAIEYLSTCSSWEDYNVILEIANPMRCNELDRRIEVRVDEFLKTRNHFPLFTVSETIFPAAEYKRHGPNGVYETYPNEIYPAIKRLKELRWGTYAYRLVRREGPHGVINPLQCCVEKIKMEVAGNSTKAACYELSLSDVCIDIPLYEPLTDRNIHIGGPCLSHVSLKVTREKKLMLTALYRSHYYVQKALGNLLGLARLQGFVCEQTELEPGPMVCVSTFAKLECESPAWAKSDVTGLIGELTVLTTEAALPRNNVGNIAL